MIWLLLAYSNALRFQRLDLECHTEIDWVLLQIVHQNLCFRIQGGHNGKGKHLLLEPHLHRAKGQTKKGQKKPEMELKSFSSHFQEGTVGLKKTDLFTITQLITVDIVCFTLAFFFPEPN